MLDGDIDPVVEEALKSHPLQVVERYRHKHGLSPHHAVTAEMVRKHFYTERRLARSILTADKKDRPGLAEQAYTAFYSECSWLDAWHETETQQEELVNFGPFLHLLRGAGSSVYEVGSGSGRLAGFLSRHGFRLIATEISVERQARARSANANFDWHISDGIHLSRYEPGNSYDHVLSTQVIEHIHPDDVGEHFAHVHAILKPGGTCVFNTPHRFSGPKDISEIFGMRQSECFHLKEWTYQELSTVLRTAGFRRLKAVYVVPKRARMKSPALLNRPIVSSVYLRLLIALEAWLATLAPTTRRKIIRLASAAGLWRPDVFMVASK